jgi:hypothetical protein
MDDGDDDDDDVEGNVGDDDESDDDADEAGLTRPAALASLKWTRDELVEGANGSDGPPRRTALDGSQDDRDDADEMDDDDPAGTKAVNCSSPVCSAPPPPPPPPPCR